MLTTIIHASLAQDPYERDENKKHFVNLVKKVRKEIGEKASRTKQTVRQLLPIVRMPRHIIAVESNEKSQYPGIDLIDRVPGLRATEKQKVNTWDLIEGNSKNPAPLSWAWFGAVKMERRPMKYEKGYDLLKYHTHNLAKSRSYFTEPLVITVKEPPPAPPPPPPQPQPTIPADDTNMAMNMNNMPSTSMAAVQMVYYLNLHRLNPLFYCDDFYFRIFQKLSRQYQLSKRQPFQMFRLRKQWCRHHNHKENVQRKRQNLPPRLLLLPLPSLQLLSYKYVFANYFFICFVLEYNITFLCDLFRHSNNCKLSNPNKCNNLCKINSNLDSQFKERAT